MLGLRTGSTLTAHKIRDLPQSHHSHKLRKYGHCRLNQDLELLVRS